MHKGAKPQKYPQKRREPDAQDVGLVAEDFPVIPPIEERKPIQAHVNFPTSPARAHGGTVPRISDTKTLFSATFRGDGKIFYLDAVKNERGEALRIVEVSKGKRTIIMVPFSQLPNFDEAQQKVLPHFSKPNA